MTAPKSDGHEWLFRVGDYAIRDITDEEREAERLPVWDDYSIVVHIPTGERLGADGGEPEDQTLLRDWSWIPHALDAAEKRGREAAAKDAAELERLRRLETKVVIIAHNAMAYGGAFAPLAQQLHAALADEGSDQ